MNTRQRTKMQTNDIASQALVALAQLQPALQEDGADLELDRVEDDMVWIRLLFRDETCEECIASKEILEQIILVSIKEKVPSIRGIHLMDPRTGPVDS